MSQIMNRYGELVFTQEVMRNRLSEKVYSQLINTIVKGDMLDKEIAGEVAHSMKEWAIENGATHYTHWFQPLRGGTAEKHNSFISYDEEGILIERLSAIQLIQSEPDASSFPSGGIRSTFEARGYSAWDPTSPVFLIEANKTKTLVIPSIFLSWTGDVLDQKTGLLRSKKALNNAGIKLQKLLGNRNAKRINVWLGIEQEYFLVDKELYETRADLQICKQTLFGRPAARNQQLKDHYFGTIKKRVLLFMEDLDCELYRRGIPAKTRHNEVSPNQFEIAPLYEEQNLAIDHNLQAMDIIEEVAERHKLVALLHEKPFRGVNGSGKHVNWSIGDNTGVNYLEPSASPLRNITLLMTVVSMMIGVKKYSNLLNALVLDAGNEKRLGGTEAPPNIMSVYLGEYVSSLLEEIEKMNKVTEKKMAEISLGIRQLPSVAKDISDRNRTSPMAYTGNKFEFRSVGSSQNCSEVVTLLNLIITEGYERIYEKILKMNGDPKSNALLVVKEMIKETKEIHFEGNCYSAEWKEEAKKRGLMNFQNTPEALEVMINKDVLDLYSKFEVLSEKELLARQNIRFKQYVRTKQIEFQSACEMSKTEVMPAILKQISLLISANTGKSELVVSQIKELEILYKKVNDAVELIIKKTNCHCMNELLDQARAYCQCNSDLENLRVLVDMAEGTISREYWPFATYQQLFRRL